MSAIQQLLLAGGITLGYSGTLTAGTATSGPVTTWGYSAAIPIGSISPGVMTQGYTIDTMDAVNASGTLFTTLVITVPFDPSQFCFIQLVSNSNTLLATAATYNYTGGVATWTWNGLAIWQTTGNFGVTIS